MNGKILTENMTKTSTYEFRDIFQNLTFKFLGNVFRLGNSQKYLGNIFLKIFIFVCY